MSISLRDLEDDDVDLLFTWRNEPEVDRWMYSVPPTLDAHRAWFAAFVADPDRKGWIILRDGGPCGSLTLEGLVSAQRRAKWGWYIGDAEARGRGAGRAAQALGLDEAFGAYGLQKVWSEIRAENETAVKAQTWAGFRREGYLRRHAYKHGQFRDVALMSILKEEWAARRPVVVKELRASGLIDRREQETGAPLIERRR
jgi:UDP-4-amino-4,6-dideoxy-N-acetyl-beta-L-altrosamine N-acetyltransferase